MSRKLRLHPPPPLKITGRVEVDEVKATAKETGTFNFFFVSNFKFFRGIGKRLALGVSMGQPYN